MRQATGGNNPISATILVLGAGAAVAILAAAATLTVGSSSAQAKPEYAAQTGLPCGQCHANPAGGLPLKAFGKRFQDNGHKLKK